MIVERKRHREYWFNSLLNYLPDLVIALAATLLMDNGWLFFVGVLFGLQLIYFAVWLRNSLWIWARFKLFDKKRGVNRIVQFLRSGKFPRLEYVESSDNYLAMVTEGENYPVNIRLMAAGELGALNYLRATMRVQEMLRLSLIFDEALEQYGQIKEADEPPSSPSETDPSASHTETDDDNVDEDGDEEAQFVMVVKALCEIAKNRYDDYKESGDEYEKQQFEKYRDRAIEKMEDIEDKFYNGMAIHELIELFVLTNELEEAKKYFNGIEDEFIRGRILEDFPQLA